jgi:hypothetical protein
MVQYSLRNGVISQVNPGVFFYWVRVTALPGNNTFTITETITTLNFSALFNLANGGSNVFNSNCSSVSPTITQNALTKAVTVMFNAPSAGTYYIALKYDTDVRGNPAPFPGTTVHYLLNTLTVPGSMSGLDLVLKP